MRKAISNEKKMEILNRAIKNIMAIPTIYEENNQATKEDTDNWTRINPPMVANATTPLKPRRYFVALGGEHIKHDSRNLMARMTKAELKVNVTHMNRILTSIKVEESLEQEAQ